MSGHEIEKATFADSPGALAPIPDSSPLGMLVQAAGGLDIEKLRALMEMQKELVAMQARQAYVAAMAAFKADPPRIFKDKSVNFGAGKASFSHARLGEICKAVIGGLAEHGLSHHWTPEQDGNRIKVTCTITHRQGHSESVSMEALPDNSGSKNTIQQIGSTQTYLQRYTLMAITGLAAEDDDDGQGAAQQRGNVGEYRDPAERRQQVDDAPPADEFAWREFYPEAWKEEKMGGRALDELTDKELGMQWKKNPMEPRLCAWAAGWILDTMIHLPACNWNAIQSSVRGVPAAIHDCNPGHLWAIAAHLRKLRAEQEGGGK